MDNKIINEDIDYILNSSCIEWEKLKNTNILVTGATGLICSLVVKALVAASERYNLDLKVYCSVRNISKAESVYSDVQNKKAIRFIKYKAETDVSDKCIFDYIIHGAAPTSSKFFIEYPVETIHSMVNDTMHFLDIAKINNSKGFVYLSSMEAYGQVNNEELLTEDKLGFIDLSNVRSSYPESKRISELLCKSYANEHNIRIMSIRLAQTFGAGISADDNRVFAMMARSVINKENIVLLTKGESKHPYLYTAQAAEAILCVLIKGEKGEVYNAANPCTYCSIYEMGLMVAEKLANGEINVVINETSENKKYPPASYLNLDIGKIMSIGWKPSGSLVDIYSRMMAAM
ncbi:NAD-dependent epimerase/dehydratase family protein [Ruminococcus sp.]|uniref:NAD-dependent epimerase/dehydratase family protein n=1 Tax=Ruminococcus sp. TaxID=41978 RepID=UPI0025CD9D5B|nr:NAD-dependent epimerase/dehydratase family protein [Ruminococcus sp.]MCR4639496.1 NAD-dependent epimerase/dehydratase family protein [Ruminococcus sp.]